MFAHARRAGLPGEFGRLQHEHTRSAAAWSLSTTSSG